jgi:hypothetical protein
VVSVARPAELGVFHPLAVSGPEAEPDAGHETDDQGGECDECGGDHGSGSSGFNLERKTS